MSSGRKYIIRRRNLAIKYLDYVLLNIKYRCIINQTYFSNISNIDPERKHDVRIYIYFCRNFIYIISHVVHGYNYSLITYHHTGV